MIEIVIATKNLHKLREIREIFSDLEGVEFLSLQAFPDYTPPEETGKTFKENATLKATDAAAKLGQLTIADDSGLVVPALEGRPGVHSRRFAGPDATDKDNRVKLLQEMKKLSDEGRHAYFACAVAVATPEGLVRCETGTCEGEILEKERGSNGFGYDSLFLKHDYNKTLAELDPTIKNRISHRRKAMDKVRGVVELQTQLASSDGQLS